MDHPGQLDTAQRSDYGDVATMGNGATDARVASIDANDAAWQWKRGSAPSCARPSPGFAQGVQLGRSPVHVSRVIFGSMAIGSARHDGERRTLTIRAALDAGITTIDSAPMYELGACEQAVGMALRGVTGDVQILSKVGLRWDDARGQVLFRTRDEHGQTIAIRKNSRPDSVRFEVDRSLKRLGVEVLDAVHVHMRDPLTPIDETMGALKDLLGEGKLRAIGVSTNFGPLEVAVAQRALGDIPLASVQLCYNLLDRSFESGLLPLARDTAIGVLARSPLATGLLTGALEPGCTFDEGDRRRAMPRFHPENIRRVSLVLRRCVAPIAADHGVSIATVALAWVLNRPTVSAIVVGASHPHHARTNAEAFDLKLGADEDREIQMAFEGLVLNPTAGVHLARRALSQARWFAGAFERLLGL